MKRRGSCDNTLGHQVGFRGENATYKGHDKKDECEWERATDRAMQLGCLYTNDGKKRREKGAWAGGGDERWRQALLFSSPVLSHFIFLIDNYILFYHKFDKTKILLIFIITLFIKYGIKNRKALMNKCVIIMGWSVGWRRDCMRTGRVARRVASHLLDSSIALKLHYHSQQTDRVLAQPAIV